MYVAGIDIGAGTAKAVVLEDKEIVCSSIIQVTGNLQGIAEEVIDETLRKCNLSLNKIERIVSTGYGRNSVLFAHATASEIICHSIGVNFLLPQVRTIIEIGAQDSKVIKCNETGRVSNFVMNDKCAAGTGRFLEVMACVLGIDLQEMGRLSLTSKNPCIISSTCTVFAETEVISLRAQGKPVEDLIAGIHKSVISRIMTLGACIKFEDALVFTGGVAKNVGVREALEEASGMEVLVPEEPQITGALGAALSALSEISRVTVETS